MKLIKFPKISKELAVLYGIMLGDGCLSKAAGKNFISICGSFYDDKPFYDNVLRNLVEKFRGRATNYRERPKHGKIEFNFVDKNLFAMFNKLGFPIGVKGDKIYIPKVFEGRLFRHAIAGLFSTDGSLVLTNNNGILYPRIEIQSICEKVLLQVRDFLNSNGLNGYVYNVKNGTIYRLQYNGKGNLHKFKHLIGFINPKHEEKFRNFISRGSSDSPFLRKSAGGKRQQAGKMVERQTHILI